MPMHLLLLLCLSIVKNHVALLREVPTFAQSRLMRRCVNLRERDSFPHKEQWFPFTFLLLRGQIRFLPVSLNHRDDFLNSMSHKLHLFPDFLLLNDSVRYVFLAHHTI